MDFFNRTADEVNALIQKYSNLLELIKEQQYIPYLAVIIDIGIKHIKENHNDLSVNWKAWAMVYLKNRFFKGKINNELDVRNSIDVLVNYYNDRYGDYVNNIGFSVSDFDRDHGFVSYFKENY